MEHRDLLVENAKLQMQVLKLVKDKGILIEKISQQKQEQFQSILVSKMDLIYWEWFVFKLLKMQTTADKMPGLASMDDDSESESETVKKQTNEWVGHCFGYLF